MTLQASAHAVAPWTRWPLPAAATWLVCWALYAALSHWLGATESALVATGLGALMAWAHHRPWRRALVALGFPASALAAGSALPAWGWLLPLGVLASAYPMRAWRDAPLFPTPPRALDALAPLLPVRAGSDLLDAGCGLGHGLRALRSAWPQCRVHGVEWSWPLAMVASLRCPWARVCRGDMWVRSWSGFDVVYVFQRPESMARAWDKAVAEMPCGAWLVSLEFSVPGRAPDLCLDGPGERRVLAWRLPYRADAQPAGVAADKPG